MPRFKWKHYKIAPLYLGIYFLVCCPIASQAGDSAPVRVGYFEYMPHTHTINGQAAGASVDFFNLVAAEMGLKHLVYKPYPINRLIQFLETNQVDVGLYFIRDEDHTVRFSYPTDPFHTVPFTLAVRADNPLDTITCVEDLDSMRIGYLDGAYLPPLLNDKRVRFGFLYGQDWTIKNLRRIQKGLLEAALSGHYQMSFEIEMHGLSDEFKLLQLPGPGADVFTVMSPEFAKQHLASYEAALQRVLAKTSYRQIFEHYIETNGPAIREAHNKWH